MVDTLGQWLEPLGLSVASVVWTTVFVVAAFVGSIVLVAALVVLMPADYFVNDRISSWRHRHPVLRWTLFTLRNLLGAALIVMGMLMLFTPGQGVLTLLFGLMLLSFPGKRRLELWLLRRRGVLPSINRLRARFGKPPLEVPHKTKAETEQREEARVGD
jgi:hypothetical protein